MLHLVDHKDHANTQSLDLGAVGPTNTQVLHLVDRKDHANTQGLDLGAVGRTNTQMLHLVDRKDHANTWFDVGGFWSNKHTGDASCGPQGPCKHTGFGIDG